MVLAGGLHLMPGGFGAGSLERRLAEYRDRGLLDHQYDALVWHIAQPYVWHTPLERTMTVNSSRVPGGVNLYVFREDPERYFDRFDCQCGVVEPGDTIVCDAELLDYLRDFLTEPLSGPFHREFLEIWTEARRKLGEPVGPEDQRRGLEAYDAVAVAYARALLRWVIGHEIGHVRLDHLDQDDIPVKQREVSADDFVVDTLVRNGDSRDLLFMSLMLESMLNTLYADSYNQLHPAEKPIVGFPFQAMLQPEITLADTGDHPPLLSRTLSMWKRMGEEPEFSYISGVAPGIESKIKVEPSGAKLSLCSSAPTVYLAHQLVILREPASLSEMVNTHIDTGLLWADMTRYDIAERELDQAVTAAEELTGTERTQWLTDAYRWRGTIRYIQRNHTGARADLEQAATSDEGQVDVHSMLGWNRLATGDLAGAATSWRTALNLAPDHADALAGLAITETEQGSPDQGVAYYRAVVARDPGYGSNSWLKFSRFLPDEAIQQLEKVRRASGS
ncbi:hypothetical protein GCM10027088_67320 [Nocardia goodfellowii]